MDIGSDKSLQLMVEPLVFFISVIMVIISTAVELGRYVPEVIPPVCR